MSKPWIDDPVAALRHYSTIALAFLVFLSGAWMLVPAETIATFPPGVSTLMGYVTFGVAVAGLWGKFRSQAPAEPGPL